jgi:hypothetical protein
VLQSGDEHMPAAHRVPAARRFTGRSRLAAFFTVLDRYTLADLIRAPEQLTPLLGLDQQ